MYKVGTKNRPICFEQVGHETTYRIVLVRVTNVCFIKIRSKLTSVLLLCLLRIFMKQTLIRKLTFCQKVTLHMDQKSSS